MSKKVALINVDFIDVYTKEKYEAGDTEVFTDERISEIKAVNSDFITVIGAVEEEKAEDDKQNSVKAESK